MGRGAESAKQKYLLTYGMSGKQLRQHLHRRQKGQCPLCRQALPKGYIHSRSINIDHVWPRSHGGPSAIWNVQLTHARCNNLKLDRCTYDRCPKCIPLEDS